MTTGQRIKTARKNAGLTQKELGEKLGVAYQTIAQWENDLRNPKQETVQRISNALDCDFYWLLWGTGLSIEDRQAYNVMRVFNTNDFHIEKAAKLAVYYAEREHKSKGYSFGDTEEKLIHFFSSLNTDGQQKALERVEELTEIPKYTKRFEALSPDEKHWAETGQWQKLIDLNLGPVEHKPEEDTPDQDKK